MILNMGGLPEHKARILFTAWLLQLAEIVRVYGAFQPC